MRAITRSEARAVDRRASGEFGIPSLCLMENAGAGAARVALERWDSLASEAVCLCGPGQNGGDALVVARHLAVAGGRPRILRVGARADSPLPGDAGLNLAVCRALGLPLRAVADDADLAAAREWLDSAGILVDGIFGTGLTRAPGGLEAAVIDAVNAAGRPVLALDVPSGLDCDSGAPLGACVRAHVTATFVAPKAGFARPGAPAWTGDVVVVGIGAPAEWPPRPA